MEDPLTLRHRSAPRRGGLGARRREASRGYVHDLWGDTQQRSSLEAQIGMRTPRTSAFAERPDVRMAGSPTVGTMGVRAGLIAAGVGVAAGRLGRGTIKATKNMGWQAPNLMDSVGRGLFTASLLPFAAIAYPVMKMGGTAVKATMSMTPGAGRGIMRAGKSALAHAEKNVNRHPKAVIAGGLGLAAALTLHGGGKELVRRRGERDPAHTMGLTNNLYHAHR